MENIPHIWEEVKKYDDKKEICIICGVELEYNRGTPINQREHYVEGCGQLCRNCAISLQIFKTR